MSRRQQTFKDFAERAIHRTMIRACGDTGQHAQADWRDRGPPPAGRARARRRTSATRYEIASQR